MKFDSTQCTQRNIFVAENVLPEQTISTIFMYVLINSTVIAIKGDMLPITLQPQLVIWLARRTKLSKYRPYSFLFTVLLIFGPFILRLFVFGFF